ncbi:hypothetical protein ACOALA_13390 [Alicyclobacillus acidoterrestris]|uniref:hypothetical protein n=1 Tax=Alicyclobacillus acidoterrestris TaxID=1450 RepID=UPI003F53C425
MTLVQVATSPEAIAVYSLVVAGLEKKFQFIKPVVSYIKDHKEVATAVVAEGEKLAGEVLHSPKLAELEVKLSKAENELSQNKLVQLAGQVLHATGKRLDELTANQKTGIALVVSTEAQKLGLTVTQAEVLTALSAADKAVDVIGGLPLFKSAKEIDAPAPVQQEQTSPAGDGQAAQPTVS